MSILTENVSHKSFSTSFL